MVKAQDSQQKPQLRQLYLELAVLAAVVLALTLPRGLEIARFATPDEYMWLQRSANFYYALIHGDYAATYQREHPGVTVMWAGTLGLSENSPTIQRMQKVCSTWKHSTTT